MVVGREGVAPRVENGMNGQIIEDISASKPLESCFNEDGRPQEEAKIRVGQGLKTNGAIEMMFDVRNVRLAVKREL